MCHCHIVHLNVVNVWKTVIRLTIEQEALLSQTDHVMYCVSRNLLNYCITEQ